MPTPLYNFIAAVSWPALHGLFRLQHHGLENLPAEGGFVLAANHTSNFDPWPLGLPLWPKRQLLFMAKAELFPLDPRAAPAGFSGAFRSVAEKPMSKLSRRPSTSAAPGAWWRCSRKAPGSEGATQEVRAQAASRLCAIALTAGVPLVPAAIKGMDRLSRLPKLRSPTSRSRSTTSTGSHRARRTSSPPSD
jgi:1-acyl-sn-glycerol-3-phosphate acyltransferase